MLVRRIARPMFAAGFVSQGIEAFRNPDPHVARTEAAWHELGPRLGLPPAPGAAPLRLVVRAHGAATTVAAVMLALGRAPRSSALMLAALTVPLAVINQPFGRTARLVATAAEGTEGAGGHSRSGRPIGATGGVSTASVRAGGADRADLGERFARNLSMIGGALIAAIDTEGRPGIAWRARHARVDRAAAREARLAVASAAKDARAAVRQARRSAG